MGHDKTRSNVSIGDVDWSDPHLNSLLQKADGWKVDNRSDLQPQEVQIQAGCGWHASDVTKPALLVSEQDGIMVLITRFPLPHGEDVRVNSQAGGNLRTRWGVVVEGREGNRVEDRQSGLYLSWLRAR